MQNTLIKFIKEEDKKNPLTDEQLAEKMFMNRSEVTQLRQSLGLPDSRERRKSILLEEIKMDISQNLGISERCLTKLLNKKGFDISRYSVSKAVSDLESMGDLMEKAEPSKHVAVKSEVYRSSNEPFSTMIGWNKSLQVKVEKAKAAVLYPPNGLHTLIVGATGVGKSELAECMYKFAIHSRGLNSNCFPFVVFNCADYAENPQLLLAQLFGYNKGAFTGAETDREGLVSKADGGILFLDEVHRLPPDGQEILYHLIDKGKYRRLGETSMIHDAKVMIIAATTEDIEKSLLGAFCRRIPMVIELTSLAMRPLEERLEIIKMFFQKEAARINKKIEVSYNVLKTLLVYDCIGNIGQLRSDIQVTCARGFLAFVVKNGEGDCITVDFGYLPTHAIKGLLNTQWNRVEIEKIISDNLVFLPDTEEANEMKESLDTFSSDFYKNIEEEYQELSKHGLSDDIINRIIGDDLEAKVKQIIKQVERNKQKLLEQDLKLIVNPQIVDLVQEMIKIARAGLGEMDDTLFYCLATHLNASVERIKSGGNISNPHLESIKKNNPKEFRIATEMSSFANYYLGINLPEEEIGFIAMYLRSLAKKDVNPKDNIGIVVVTHGHVAEGIASVANRLLGVDLVQAVEMSLDEKPEMAYDRTLEAVMKADRNRGVIILVDMGSLVGFGSFITKKTGIATRTVSRVDTLMVIDAVRKALLPESDINEVADSLIKGKNTKITSFEYENPIAIDKPAVISICLTGEGTAKKIEKVVYEEFQRIDPRIKIVTLGIINGKDIIEQIERIRRSLNVLIIIGTVNPSHLEIPFFSAADVLREGGVRKLGQMLRTIYKKDMRMESISYKEAFHSAFSKDLILVNKDANNKSEALRMICELLVKRGSVSAHFIQGVLEREEIGSTAIGTTLAIPHGNSEDIILPAVGVMTLKKPVEWCEGNKISLIFLLALNENSKSEFQRVHKIIKNVELAKKIMMKKNAKEIFEILENV